MDTGSFSSHHFKVDKLKDLGFWVLGLFRDWFFFYVVDGLFLPGLLAIVLLARYVGDVVIGMLAGVFCALALLAKKIVVPGTFS